MSKSQYQWTIFSIIATGSFLGMLDSSTVNVALYKISQNLNAKLEDVQWVITAYMLVLTIFLPLLAIMFAVPKFDVDIPTPLPAVDSI